MNRWAKWLAGIAAVFCALFWGVTQIVLPNLLKQVGPYAEKLAADYVNGSVQIGSVAWPGSNRILIQDVTVKDQKQQGLSN